MSLLYNVLMVWDHSLAVGDEGSLSRLLGALLGWGGPQRQGAGAAGLYLVLLLMLFRFGIVGASFALDSPPPTHNLQFQPCPCDPPLLIPYP